MKTVHSVGSYLALFKTEVFINWHPEMCSIITNEICTAGPQAPQRAACFRNVVNGAVTAECAAWLPRVRALLYSVFANYNPDWLHRVALCHFFLVFFVKLTKDASPATPDKRGIAALF